MKIGLPLFGIGSPVFLIWQRGNRRTYVTSVLDLNWLLSMLSKLLFSMDHKTIKLINHIGNTRVNAQSIKNVVKKK